ncbi:chemotaxis protein CheW [Aliidongia dinghuensis]|uniref:Chemotaxis protein CheW n=1 Tax=Aliidongia dinghuensis TaxID=1867774 RepID=A0A8J3E319_9PROT|nr:chemotaxis protein CheW [Aliidongia dinghuensis]GGF12850.1 chemotaxis protein CheW [Aliidongia dinghuensis]
MAPALFLLSFTLGHQRYALHLAAVERAVRIVEIVPLPEAPDIVLGIINMHGRVIPVVDTRKRFGLAARRPTLDDHLIVARTSSRSVALLVDRVGDVLELAPADVIAATDILPNMAYVDGVAKLKNGTIVVHDLTTFLSLDEEAKLDAAVGAAAEASHGF